MNFTQNSVDDVYIIILLYFFVVCLKYTWNIGKKRGFRFLESPFLKNMVKCDSFTELS